MITVTLAIYLQPQEDDFDRVSAQRIDKFLLHILQQAQQIAVPFQYMLAPWASN